jgi:hypothetical protein
MGIFRQNTYFSKVLVVWGARVQALIVLRPLGESVVIWGLNCIFFLKKEKEIGYIV